MYCCCLKILNLCDQNVCGTLEINKAATGLGSGAESGAENIYTLVLDFLETTVTISKEQTEGENIYFPVDMLNENFQYIGKIYDSNGDLVTITEDSIDYDCIKFKTRINVVI